MGKYRHRDTGFEVWPGKQSWFWLVENPRGGAIGAANTEAEALRDARLSIEEMTAIRPACGSEIEAPPAWRMDYESGIFAAWENSLANLARYLNCLATSA